MNHEILLPIALITGGFILILAEVLILPGLITGIIGFILIVSGVVFSYQNFGSTGAGIAIISALIAGAALVMVMIRARLWHRFVLETNQNQKEGYSTADANLKELIGKQGVAFTFLRPSGQVKIDGIKYDSMAQGNFIKKDTTVEIIGISGSQLVVKELHCSE